MNTRMNYFVHLTKLDLHPIPLEYHAELKKAYHTSVDLNLLNLNLINILEKNDIYICYIETFFSAPHFTQAIHTDSSISHKYGGDYVKINWVYCEGESHMNWYEVKENVPQPDIETTVTNTGYIPWRADQVEKVAIDELKFPSLVQSGCPHNVENGSKHRLCISAVIRYISTNNRITMEEACNRLSFLI